MSILIESMRAACGTTFTGFQIFATRDGSVIVDHAEGLAAPDVPMTTETPCYWYSGTKSAIAVALAQLWERERFSINDRLENLIKGVSFLSPEIGNLTLRDVLTYAIPTSPWQDPIHDPNIPDSDVIRHIVELVPSGEQDPRRYTGYAAWPWILAGLMIEQISNLPLPVYVQNNVFTPLGMTHSSLGIPAAAAEPCGGAQISRLRRGSRVTALMAAGAGWGPMRDLSRLYLCVLNGGTIDNRRIAGEPAVTALTSRLRAGYLYFNNKFVDYGMGFEIEANWYPEKASPSFSTATSARTFGHKGLNSMIIFADPADGITCAIFANADGQPSKANSFTELLRKTIYDWYAELRIPVPVSRK
jgi:CubicO group peptidase (beta-lactamase class C family)